MYTGFPQSVIDNEKICFLSFLNNVVLHAGILRSVDGGRFNMLSKARMRLKSDGVLQNHQCYV